MPAVNSVPCQATSPIASTAGEEKLVANNFVVSLSDGVPEMCRRTLAAISPLIPFPRISCWDPLVALDAQIDISETDKLKETTNPAENEAEMELEKEASTPSSHASPWALKPSVGTWLMPLHSNTEADREVALEAFECRCCKSGEAPLFEAKGNKLLCEHCLRSNLHEACEDLCSQANVNFLEQEQAIRDYLRNHQIKQPKAVGFGVSESTDSQPQVVNVAKVRSKGLGARAKTLLCCVQASAAKPKPAKSVPKAPKASKTQPQKKDVARAKASN
jgi:hypothetical protein